MWNRKRLREQKTVRDKNRLPAKNTQVYLWWNAPTMVQWWQVVCQTSWHNQNAPFCFINSSIDSRSWAYVFINEVNLAHCIRISKFRKLCTVKRITRISWIVGWQGMTPKAKNGKEDFPWESKLKTVSTALLISLPGHMISVYIFLLKHCQNFLKSLLNLLKFCFLQYLLFLMSCFCGGN